MCDNSRSLSEEQYAERTKRLEELFGPKKQVRVKQVKQEENSDGN
jgi:ATP-dependent DNA ligase